ncbi:MAG: FAD-dependent oxidoreductase, partial [Deltaproteobacteria bacterium]|nr:FAD-dependent oxidoreductase [Deltaproteobacteria bacterium]
MVAPSAVDIAVIGGGISGLGVALEAALNGFEVALFEKGPLASATSANSLRIMHGGIRYLQQMNLPRVMESVRAQAELLADFPDIVRPLPCVMPLTSGGLKSAVPMKVA